MMHWGNFGGMGIGGFGFGWIFMILFWALVILGIVYIAKQLFGSTRTTHVNNSAEDILKRIYITGEISRDEYNEKLKLIGKNQS